MGESIVIVIPMTMVVLMKWNVNEATFINSGECINSLRPSDAYMRQ